MKRTFNSHQPLPRKKGLFRNWSIHSCLSLSVSSKVYLLTSHVSEEKAVLKILPENQFSKSNYYKLFRASNPYLCLPSNFIHKSKNYYLLYSHNTSLQELLCVPGLFLTDIITLGIDLAKAVSFLLEQQFYEIDIHPGNIYCNQEKHFCLGDISFQSGNAFLYSHEYMAPELPFLLTQASSAQNLSLKSVSCLYQYTICLLLLRLCNQGDFPPDNKVPPIPDSLLFLLQKGTSPQPDSRFTSLQELIFSLEGLRKENEISSSHYFIQIREATHPLFQTKTSVLSQQTPALQDFSCRNFIEKLLHKPYFIYIILWMSLIFFGCLFLSLLYQQIYLKPPENESLYLSQIVYTDSPSSSTSAASSASVSKDPQDELNIENQKLTSLSKRLISPKKTIHCIYAGYNNFSSLTEFQPYLNLKELYLNNNHIAAIENTSLSSQLQILILSSNQLSDISGLTGITSLSYLDLSSNPKLSESSPLYSLTNLNTLVLTNTGYTKKQIQSLENKLSSCTIISDFSKIQRHP